MIKDIILYYKKKIVTSIYQFPNSESGFANSKNGSNGGNQAYQINCRSSRSRTKNIDHADQTSVIVLNNKNYLNKINYIFK